MNERISLRPGSLDDGAACASILFEAFGRVNARHGFVTEYPSLDYATFVMNSLLADPRMTSVVAEMNGEVVGSNFLLDGAIGAVGPLSVGARAIARGVGRRLMDYVLDVARHKGMAGVRLVVASFNLSALALYSRLDFEVREPLACLQGCVREREVATRHVRAGTLADVEICDRLCVAAHGHDRRDDFLAGVRWSTARVVEHDGAITGYASQVGYLGHAVAVSNLDLMALIAAAGTFDGLGVLVPLRNRELFEWCLRQGLTIVHPKTLMTRGFYRDPCSPFLPSIAF